MFKTCCEVCGAAIRFDEADTGGHRLPDEFDTQLKLKGKHVGTIPAYGEATCAPCEETR